MSMHKPAILLLLILGTALDGQCQEALQQAQEHIRAGEPSLAEARYREALRQDPSSGPAGTGLSLTLLELGRYEEALEVAREAVEQLLEAQSLSSGLDRMNQLNLGELYSSNGDLDKAQEFYLNALALTTTRGPTSAVESALREAYEKNGGAPEQFDSFLERRLAGRKIARRDELLAEPVDFAAPGFRLEDLEGKTFEITQAQGKVVMLTFWASW